MSLDSILDLKKKVEELQRRADKAQGALDGLVRRLEEEFGCSTLEEAQILLEEFEQEEKDAEKAFKKAMRKFQKKWGDLLDES